MTTNPTNKCSYCSSDILTRNMLKHLMDKHFDKVFSPGNYKNRYKTRLAEASEDEPLRLGDNTTPDLFCCFGCNTATTKNSMCMRFHFSLDDTTKDHGKAHLAGCRALIQRIEHPESYEAPKRKPRTVKLKPQPSPVRDPVAAPAAAPVAAPAAAPEVKIVEKVVEKIVYRDSTIDYDTILTMVMCADSQAFKEYKEKELLKYENQLLRDALELSTRDHSKLKHICGSYRKKSQSHCIEKNCGRKFDTEELQDWIDQADRYSGNESFASGISGLGRLIKAKDDELKSELANPFSTIMEYKEELIQMGCPEEDIDNYC